MAKMPMPQAEEAAPKGGASEVITGVHSGLVELMDIFNSSQAIAPEDKQALSQILTQYQGLIENMSQPQGAQAPEPKGGVGLAPMEAGAAKVRPAL